MLFSIASTVAIIKDNVYFILQFIQKSPHHTDTGQCNVIEYLVELI